MSGLSPPARGIQARPVGRRDVHGSIPARAGDPSRRARADSRRRLYPRPCGGSHALPQYLRVRLGLSPPARGIRGSIFGDALDARSIPARAGDPGGAWLGACRVRVYPRPRGGSMTKEVCDRIVRGLSPPARGIRRLLAFAIQASRSIPARAGDPRGVRAAGVIRRVYPRPRGGSALICDSALSRAGLSPPARGILRRENERRRRLWSIPARAGYPS